MSRVVISCTLAFGLLQDRIQHCAGHGVHIGAGVPCSWWPPAASFSGRAVPQQLPVSEQPMLHRRLAVDRQRLAGSLQHLQMGRRPFGRSSTTAPSFGCSPLSLTVVTVECVSSCSGDAKRRRCGCSEASTQGCAIYCVSEAVLTRFQSCVTSVFRLNLQSVCVSKVVQKERGRNPSG